VLVNKAREVIEGRSEMNEISPLYSLRGIRRFWRAGILMIAIR